MNDDDLVRTVAELKTEITAISASQKRIEETLTQLSGSLAVLLAHDQEHKKKLAVWRILSRRPLFPASPP